jgi:hypothetical protein
MMVKTKPASEWTALIKENIEPTFGQYLYRELPVRSGNVWHCVTVSVPYVVAMCGSIYVT